jgi:predicted nicotinamide N-methyase
LPPDLLAIVRGYAEIRPVALVPEIRLYQASEPIGLWQRTEAAAGQAGLDPPFWAFAWAGGQALARYLLDHPEVVRDRHVADIASGSGLVAIAAARAGAASVAAYDIDPLAAAAITVNAAANDVPVTVFCADILDPALPHPGLPHPGLPHPALPDQAGSPSPGTDLVLVADAFYQRDLAVRMHRFLNRSRNRGAAVLVGDLGRAYLPRDSLTPIAAYDVPGLRALESTDTKHTTVWKLALAMNPPQIEYGLLTGPKADLSRERNDMGVTSMSS